jgi:putative ATP-dependent endonuclease of OLD family
MGAQKKKEEVRTAAIPMAAETPSETLVEKPVPEKKAGRASKGSTSTVTAKVAPEASPAELSETPPKSQQRLRKMTVRNFRCIGSQGVEVELDKIVVLVGPNNVGKSSILKAYQLIMSGSTEAKLSAEDFPERKTEDLDEPLLPQVEVEVAVTDERPGARWIMKDAKTTEEYTRERFIWRGPDKAPERNGWDPKEQKYVNQKPWGFDNVASSFRPEPYRVEAFADPVAQGRQVVSVLHSALKDKLKAAKAKPKDGEENPEELDFEELWKQVGDLRTQLLERGKAEIQAAEESISKLVSEVFPKYAVKFDSATTSLPDVDGLLISSDARLLMGPDGGFQSRIESQGSGARRTLLWAALRFIAESGVSGKRVIKKDDALAARPKILLLDEPEICLHPSAIREACRVLYELPESGMWQVMVTTHSPAFIDFARDNTTVVRVERSSTGAMIGTTVFRPKRVQLDADDKARLKLLNLCDPWVAEFFFGGQTIVVEGDTEYTAFNYVKQKFPEEFKNIHVVRARGKATIVSLMKILNHFGSSYAVLHDSDRELLENGNKNSAWAHNEKIDGQRKLGTKVRVLASVPNFEEAFFGAAVGEEKPYSALEKLTSDDVSLGRIKQLLAALKDSATAAPAECFEWGTLDDLKKRLAPAVVKAAGK